MILDIPDAKRIADELIRREVIIDFTKYQDGSPTSKGDKIYLTNTMKMPNGRMWSNSKR